MVVVAAGIVFVAVVGCAVVVLVVVAAVLLLVGVVTSLSCLRLAALASSETKLRHISEDTRPWYNVVHLRYTAHGKQGPDVQRMSVMSVDMSGCKEMQKQERQSVHPSLYIYIYIYIYISVCVCVCLSVCPCLSRSHRCLSLLVCICGRSIVGARKQTWQ